MNMEENQEKTQEKGQVKEQKQNLGGYQEKEQKKGKKGYIYVFPYNLFLSNYLS